MLEEFNQFLITIILLFKIIQSLNLKKLNLYNKYLLIIEYFFLNFYFILFTYSSLETLNNNTFSLHKIIFSIILVVNISIINYYYLENIKHDKHNEIISGIIINLFIINYILLEYLKISFSKNISYDDNLIILINSLINGILLLVYLGIQKQIKLSRITNIVFLTHLIIYINFNYIIFLNNNLINPITIMHTLGLTYYLILKLKNKKDGAKSYYVDQNQSPYINSFKSFDIFNLENHHNNHKEVKFIKLKELKK